MAITGTINADAAANRQRLTVVAGRGTIDNGSGGAWVRSAGRRLWGTSALPVERCGLARSPQRAAAIRTAARSWSRAAAGDGRRDDHHLGRHVPGRQPGPQCGGGNAHRQHRLSGRHHGRGHKRHVGRLQAAPAALYCWTPRPAALRSAVTLPPPVATAMRRAWRQCRQHHRQRRR